MKTLKGKKVLIFQQRDWAKRIGRFLAKHLQDEGCELAAITFKKTTHKFITGQDEVKYQYIVNVDDILEYPEKYLGDDKISFADICSELNLDSIWPLIYSDRMLVRSYGEKYYYSFRQNVPDEFMVTYIKAYYKTIKELIKKFKPDLIIMAAYVYEGHVLLGLLGEKNNIPNVTITDSKVPGYGIFVHDYLVEKGGLISRVQELNNQTVKSTNLDKAKMFVDDFRKKFQKPDYINEEKKENILKKIRRELSPYKQILNWFLKGPSFNSLKTVDPTIDNRPPAIILRDHYLQKKYKKFAENFKYYDFDKVQKFIFFPLQFTPEASADLISPLFNNQIELARQIAMSLPGDYTLVVKEHPAMVGLRTPSYLEKVSRTPNVKLIDYRIPSEKILKKADAVISAYSTTLFEAAFYNKPAIMLSDSGIFKLMPNVFKHSDLSTMSKKIKEVLNLNLNTEDYERRLVNYVAGVLDVGFDFKYMKAWERGGEDLELLWKIYRTEIERIMKFGV